MALEMPDTGIDLLVLSWKCFLVVQGNNSAIGNRRRFSGEVLIPNWWFLSPPPFLSVVLGVERSHRAASKNLCRASSPQQPEAFPSFHL